MCTALALSTCGTYNDAGNAPCGITAFLQVLGDDGENTGRQRHVEKSMRLLFPLLKFLQMLVKGIEGFVLVVLPGDVRAQFTEVIQLLFHILSRCLDVRPDPPDVLLVVHLCPSISYDLDVFGQELIAVLSHVRNGSAFMDLLLVDLQDRKEQGTVTC